MKDMQFRGAISDFHPIKEHIMKSDYDPLLLRTNEDDLYGDGNNFEVVQHLCHDCIGTATLHARHCLHASCDSMNCLQLATLRSAAEVWEFIDAETERRKQRVDSAVTEQKAVKGLPPSQKIWTARPWQSLVCQIPIQMQQHMTAAVLLPVPSCILNCLLLLMTNSGKVLALRHMRVTRVNLHTVNCK